MMSGDADRCDGRAAQRRAHKDGRDGVSGSGWALDKRCTLILHLLPLFHVCATQTPEGASFRPGSVLYHLHLKACGIVLLFHSDTRIDDNVEQGHGHDGAGHAPSIDSQR